MPIFILPTCNLRRAFLVVDCTITRPQPPDDAGPVEGQDLDVRCAHMWRPRRDGHSELFWRHAGVRRIDWRKMNEQDRSDFEEQIMKKYQGDDYGH